MIKFLLCLGISVGVLLVILVAVSIYKVSTEGVKSDKVECECVKSDKVEWTLFTFPVDLPEDMDIRSGRYYLSFYSQSPSIWGLQFRKKGKNQIVNYAVREKGKKSND